MKLRILSLFAVVIISTAAFAQKTGEQLYKENACNACHMLTDMKVVGPGLKGILDRRERAWLKSWIKNSAELIASGDELAIQVFEEHNKIPMLGYDLSDEDMETLIDYIGGVEKVAEVVETTETTEAVSTEGAETAKVEEAPVVKEKSAIFKALSGRPLLSSFFFSTIGLLLLVLVAVLGVKASKKE